VFVAQNTQHRSELQFSVSSLKAAPHCGFDHQVVFLVMCPSMGTADAQLADRTRRTAG
jgi:hypothetical protein